MLSSLCRPLVQAVASQSSRATIHRRRLLWPARQGAFFFSSTPPPTTTTTDLQQELLQRLCWEAYLASGRGSDTLFKSIDVDMSGYITGDNLVKFLDSIEGKGVNPKAFKVRREEW
jgi:hypothetical protein